MIADGPWHRRALRSMGTTILGFDVFVSYARADSIAYVRELQARLERANLWTFVDYEQIPPGEELEKAIASGLRRSRLLIAVCSKQGVVSPWVMREVESFPSDRRPLVPINVEGHYTSARWNLKASNPVWIDETKAALDAGSPSPAVVENILKQVVYRRRRSLALQVAAGLLFLLGIAAATAYWNWRQLTFQRHIAERNAYATALAAADGLILASESAIGSQLSAAAEAERQLASIALTKRGWEWHYLANRLDASDVTLWGPASSSGRPGGSAERPKDSGSPALDYQGPLAISADSRQVFWATPQAVHSWDIKAGKILPALPPRGIVFAISEDGSFQLSADWQLPKPWRVIATRTGAVVSTLETSILDLQHVAFSRDGDRVVTATTKGVVQVWNSRNGTQISRAVHKSALTFISFSQDAAFLVAGAGGELLLWRFASEPRFSRIGEPATRPLIAGAVNSLSRVAVTLDQSGEIRSWTIQSFAGAVVDTNGSRRYVQVRPGRTQMYGQHPGGKLVIVAGKSGIVATAGDDGAVRLWDPSTRFRGDPPAVLNAHDQRAIDAILFSANDDYIVTGSRQGVIRVWNVRRARLGGGLGAVDSGLIAADTASISANGRFVMMGMDVIDLETLARTSLRGSAAEIAASAVADDGRTMIVGQRDGNVCLWRVAATPTMTTLQRFPDSVSDVAIAADGSLAVASSAGHARESGRLVIWDLATRREILNTATSPIRQLRINGRGDDLLILSALGAGQRGRDCVGSVELRSLKTGQLTGTTIPECVDAATFSGTGDIIAHSSTDNRFRVFSRADGSLLATSVSMPLPETLASAPNGQRFAARLDGRLSLFDTGSGAQLLTIASPHRFARPGSTSAWAARALGFSSDGQRLIEVADARIHVMEGRGRTNPTIPAGLK